MKVSKMTVMVATLTMALAAGQAFAQAAPPAQQPPAQTPPATQPPAAQPPAAQPQQPPQPFPEGAKVALINVQAIASTSAEGKAATAKIQDLQKRKSGEIQEKTKQAQSLQQKLQQGGNVLNEQARAQSEKELQKLQRDIQLLQEDAQQELNELQQQLQLDFQNKLAPVIEQVATEKGLYVVLGVESVVWGYSGIDITAEVIKRFDAAPKTAPKK